MKRPADKAGRSRKRLPIRHIGYLARCNLEHYSDSILRVDLGSKRYKRLGVRERFKDEAPYRVCGHCIRKIVAQENAWKK